MSNSQPNTININNIPILNINPTSPIKMNSFLKILSLNSRGINNEKEKMLPLFYQFKSDQFDIIALQETKISEKKSDRAASLWNGDSFWSCDDHSDAGTAILLHKNFPGKILHQQVIKAEKGRILIVPFLWQNEPFTLVNIYAPNDRIQKIEFFISLFNLLSNHPSADDPNNTLIIVGDFNSVSDLQKDRKNTDSVGNPFPVSLLNIIDAYHLSDIYRSLYPNGSEHTWSNDKMASRLDYAFIRHNNIHRVANFEHMPHEFSDHFSLRFAISPLQKTHIGKGYWKLDPDYCSKEPFYRPLALWIQENQPSQEASASIWISKIMAAAKLIASNYKAEIDKRREDAIQNMRRSLKSLSSSLMNNPDDPALKLSFQKEKQKLADYSRKKYENNKIWSQTKYFDLGEQCSKYFCQFAKKRTLASTIPALNDATGFTHYSTNGILESARSYYESLYSKRPSNNDDAKLLLDQIVFKLSEASQYNLDKPFTEDEIRLVLENLPNEKSPGPDGIPYDFWKSFSIFPKILAKAFNEWFENGELPESLTDGIITLLYKKGDPKNPANYRPITLLNCLLKILTKALSNRLSTVISSLISPHQTAIPKRYIGDNIRLVCDLIEYLKKNKIPAGIFLLDQEKAFDSVSWDYLFEVLKEMDFGPCFIKWISMIYKEPKSQLKINNHLSSSFNLQRGVRQGDALSVFLYVICIQPLISAIANDPQIQGIELPDGSYAKIAAYADDLTPFISSPSDLQRVEFWLQVHENASASKFNKEKSELILFHLPIPTQSIFTKIISDPTYHFRYLGVLCSFDLDLTRAWEEPMAKFLKILADWKKFHLSLSGKIVVLKTLALSMLIYNATFLTLPKNLLSKIQKEAWSFMWDGKKAKVNLQTCILPKELGGLSYPDFPTILSSLHANWIVRLLKKPQSSTPWSSLAFWSLQNVNYKWGHKLSCVYLPAHHSQAKDNRISFWASSLNAFWKLNPRYDPDSQHPLTPLIIKSMPLFNNHQICINGSPLKTPRWKKHFASQGIIRISDITVMDHLGTLEELEEIYQRRFPKRAYLDLIKAIPQWIVNIINQNPPMFHKDSFWGANIGGTHHIIKITQYNHPTVHGPTWKVDDPPSENEFEYFGINETKLIEYLQPLEVKTSENNLTHITYIERKEIFPDHLIVGLKKLKIKKLTTKTIRQLITPSSTPKGQEKWKGLLPENHFFPWKSVYKSIWKTPVPKKWNDNAYLLITMSHFLGEKAQKYDLDIIPHNCSCGYLETFTHLFLYCPRAKLCWNWAIQRWKSLTGQTASSLQITNLINLGSTPPTKGGSSKFHQIVWLILHRIILYSIWKARCEVIYGDKPFDLQSALYITKALIQKTIIIHSRSKNQKHLLNLHWMNKNAFASYSPDGSIIFNF